MRTRFPIWLLVLLFLRMTDTSAAAAGKERPLTQTPTWAVALVCTFFIIVSILLEKCLHKLGSWMWEKHKKALVEALEKVKAGVFHVLYSFLTMMLGRLKIRDWKKWEQQTLSRDYDFSKIQPP